MNHKLLWLFLIYIVIVVFIDENSLLNLHRVKSHNAELQNLITEYEQSYDADAKALQQLRENPEAVEEVARVRLLMKTDNEDIYIIEKLP